MMSIDNKSPNGLSWRIFSQKYLLCFKKILYEFSKVPHLTKLLRVHTWKTGLGWVTSLTNSAKRTFKNYFDIMLPFFDHLPTLTCTGFTLNIDKNNHFVGPYPSHLVHVVIECPQMQSRRHLWPSKRFSNWL